MKKTKQSLYLKVIIALVWLGIWQVAAMLIANSLVLASPLQALSALSQMSIKLSFWQSTWGSFRHITLGFLLAAVTGIILAILSSKIKYLKEFLAVPMTIFKTVPVASFIILILISLKSKDNLSTIICFMMSLPVIYTNMLAGLSSIDKKMVEMAKVFKVSKFKQFSYLYTYRILPFFSTGCKIALGMCWKSGVAAELIGLVQNTVGNELYYAKLYLMMDRVFALTIVIVVISMLFEHIVLGLLQLLKTRLEK